jgi:anti-sigma B factor antagonist
MNIKVINEEGSITFFLSGTIDIPSAESLKKSLNEVLNNPLKELILDFNEVESIGSSGIGALLLAHKEFTARGMKFSIVNVNKDVTALFKIIKLDKLFNIK